MRVESIRGTGQVAGGRWQAQAEGDGRAVIEEIGGDTLAGGKVVGEGKAPVVVGAGGGDRVHHEQCAVTGFTGDGNHGNTSGIAGARGSAVPMVGVVVVVPGAVQCCRGTGCRGIALKEVIPATSQRQVVLAETGGDKQKCCREGQSQGRHGSGWGIRG